MHVGNDVTFNLTVNHKIDIDSTRVTLIEGNYSRLWHPLKVSKLYRMYISVDQLHKSQAYFPNSHFHNVDDKADTSTPQFIQIIEHKIAKKPPLSAFIIQKVQSNILIR